MFGMLVALAVIWLGFHILSGGTFLTARNLWNLSVQTPRSGSWPRGWCWSSSPATSTCRSGRCWPWSGWSWRSLQAEWLPDLLGLRPSADLGRHPGRGPGHRGTHRGASQGFLVAFGRIPSFIVTLGGLLVWRGVAWASASGRTIAPMDMTFQRLGGGARGSIGATWSWVVGIVACIGDDRHAGERAQAAAPVRVHAAPDVGRRRHRRGQLWRVIAAVWVSNSYYLPENLARQYAEENGIAWPPGGLQISLGLPIPVLILIGVALVMTFVATRLRFGRYVFAIGGNPEAADLAGVKSRATVVKTFASDGVAGRRSPPRCRSPGSTPRSVGWGRLTELYVIAAAVIGGTSLAGGIGTISGAVLGALIMQSLQSGMVLLGRRRPPPGHRGRRGAGARRRHRQPTPGGTGDDR